MILPLTLALTRTFSFFDGQQHLKRLVSIMTRVGKYIRTRTKFMTTTRPMKRPNSLMTGKLLTSVHDRPVFAIVYTQH